jgi:hypothetical protein
LSLTSIGGQAGNDFCPIPVYSSVSFSGGEEKYAACFEKSGDCAETGRDRRVYQQKCKIFT